MLTEVSPLLNFESSHFAGAVPKRSQIASQRSGCELPAKILTFLMLVHQHKSQEALSMRVVGGGVRTAPRLHKRNMKSRPLMESYANLL